MENGLRGRGDWRTSRTAAAEVQAMTGKEDSYGNRKIGIFKWHKHTKVDTVTGDIYLPSGRRPKP